MDSRIYFDHAATTPLDPRVRQAMDQFLNGSYGNPSSMHAAGREAHAAIDEGRADVAALIGAHPGEIVFTASGTEADNLALRGVLEGQGPGDHLIVTAFEHPAVIETAKYLERLGVEVTYLPVGEDGVVSTASLASALRAHTRLVSIMTANNVAGTIQQVHELAELTHRHGALFHTDAVQGAGKVPIDVTRSPIDLLSLSAHKLHGPKGIGALYVRSGVHLRPIIYGGGQERGLRSATENVAGIVGFGRAAHIARSEMGEETARLVGLRERLYDGIAASIPNAYFIGDRYRRLPGHLCLGFAGQEGEAVKLLLKLDEKGIAVSSGSACSANHAGEPSYALTAMGLDPIRARGSLRITLGRGSTQKEVDRFLEVLAPTVQSLQTVASHSGFASRS
jgi:cysteine desulfurase